MWRRVLDEVQKHRALSHGPEIANALRALRPQKSAFEGDALAGASHLRGALEANGPVASHAKVPLDVALRVALLMHGLAIGRVDDHVIAVQAPNRPVRVDLAVLVPLELRAEPKIVQPRHGD